MNASEVVQGYLGAWSARDPEKVVAALAASGTHQDPVSGGPIAGEALRRHAARLFATFPDVSFDIVGAPAMHEDVVSVEWRMRGTNSASLKGAPATHRSLDLRGADFIALDADGIRSVRRYFDQLSLTQQLGMHLSTQTLFEVDSVQYGTSAHMSPPGRNARPEAISLTWIVPRSTEERERLRARIEQIMLEMPKTEGFLSMMVAGCANKLYTSAAWSEAKAPERMAPQGAHLGAMQDFLKGDLGSASMTSIWVPVRINGPHIRCARCDQMSDYSRDGGRCSCGEMLPDPPPYW
jgi:steroid delta-isomerase-like uncharacterized protein